MFQEMMCGRGEDLELGGRRGSSRLGLQDIQCLRDIQAASRNLG